MKTQSAILLFIIIFYSCSEYKNFTTYKLSPINETSYYLRRNGTYTLEPKTVNGYIGLDYLYFFDNGLLGFKKGHYLIRNDEIIGDWFGYEPGGTFKKFIKTFYGKVINDSTIMIERNYCKYCYKNFSEYRNSPEIVFDPPLIFKLDTNISKPDISNVWFLKKRWYKKNVWYNNQ